MAQPARRTRKQRRRSVMPRVVALLLCALVVAGGIRVGPRIEDVARSWLDGRQPAVAVVATDVLNVRSAPGTDSDILGALPLGSTVEVLGSARDGFVPVRYEQGTGWMAAGYLTFEGNELAFPNPVEVNEVVAAEPVAPKAEPTEAPPEPEAEPAPTESDIVPVPTERWIDIDRSEAMVRLYVGNEVIASYPGRIGRDPASDGFYSTAIGTYRVYTMNKGLAPTPFAEDTYLTDFVGFDPERKNGIHSPVRDANGVEKSWQNATTLGCVRLTAEAAVAVFDFAEIGMRVEVHE